MLRPGDEPIPGYRLETFLGRGQFGEVWKSTAPGGGSAALKFLDLGGKEGWKEFRGIQRVKEIRHAHLMPITALWLLDEAGNILDENTVRGLAPTDGSPRDTLLPGQAVGEDLEPCWLVVAQLLAECTLLDELERCKECGYDGIPRSELIVYMEEAAKGIDFLNSNRHDLGDGVFAVQHCDIKPANMLLLGGSVLICDFGLAQLLTSADGQVRATGMLGSPAYIAPECVEAAPSSTSDQYSLAISYCELRTGALPFPDQTAIGAVNAHRSGNLDLSKLPDVERSVIARATALNPDERYPSCLQMVRALQEGAEEPRPVDLVGSASWSPLLSTVIPALAIILLSVALIAVWLAFRPPAVATVEFTIQVEPVDAELFVDDERYALENGQISLERDANSSIKLVASMGPDFEVAVRQIDLRDHSSDEPIQIRLQHSAQFFVDDAWQKLNSDQRDAAIESYAQAIQKDSRLVHFPPPQLLVEPMTASPKEIRSMALSQNDGWLVVANSSGEVRGWKLSSSLANFRSSMLHRHQGPVEDLTVGDDWVVSTNGQGTITASSLRNMKARNLSRSLETFSVIRLGMGPNDQYLLTSSDGVLRRWDLSSTGIAAEAAIIGQHDEMIDSIQVAADRSIITGSWDGFVKQWSANGRVEDGMELGQLSDDVYAVAVSKEHVAFGGAEQGEDNRVFVVDLKTRMAQPLPDGHAWPIICLEFDSTGEWLAAGSEDGGEVSVWRNEIGQWRRIPLPNQHHASVNAVAFDPSSGFLISVGNDGRIVLWDLHRNSRRVSILDDQSAPIVRATITKDGNWLFTGSSDGSVRVWQLPRCLLVKQACDRANISAQPARATDNGVET